MRDGKTEIAPSLLKVKEGRAVAKYQCDSHKASATGREGAEETPLFLFFLCFLAGTLTVICTFLSSLYFHCL